MKRSALLDNDGTASRRSIRLMLHAVDGVIPYMTPLLLKNHFPPEQVSEHFVLGVAVRDTCISPVYPSHESISANKKRKKQKLDMNKLCGYTFSSTPMDGFLLGYKTVVVPSFDLCQDACSKNTTAACTDKQVLMWTPHGRHGLSPDLYKEATSGFDEETTTVISLYDMALDKDTLKRKQSALQRNRTWLEHCLQHTKAKVWAPVLLLQDNDKKKAVDQSLQMHSSITGMAVIGWPHIADRTDRNHRLETVVKEYCEQPQHEIAVLATHSSLQILDAVRLGVNTIGTELPTLWARSKLAFGCNIEGWAKKEVDQGVSLDENGCVDMHDAALVRDSRPLVLNCQCLSCHDNKHSRAYIHHLVLAKELLAEILLFAHNLHQLLLLCREATNALQQGKTDEFCDFVEKQMGSRA